MKNLPTYPEFREMVRSAHGGSIRYALILWHNLPLAASDLPGTVFGPPRPAPAGWAPFPAELTAPGVGEPGHYGTANDSEIGADFDVCRVHGPACPGGCEEEGALGGPGGALPSADRSLDRAVLENALTALDRKDDVIDGLKAEVERLADHLEIGSAGIDHVNARLARALLRRLGLALAAGLLASGLWAAPASAGPQAPARPLSSVAVKIMPHTAFQGRFRASRAAWAITTADADSCTAWVDAASPGLEAAGQAAYAGCRAAIGQAAQAKGGAK